MDHAQAIAELLAATESMRRQGSRTVETPRTVVEPSARPDMRLPVQAGAARDVSSALQLIQDARDALRAAERRADDLEAELQEIATQASEVIRHLKDKVSSAESRAVEAEQTLAKLHDAIFASFQPIGDRSGTDRAFAPPALRLIE